PLLLALPHLPTRAPLFPYTTLFRSHGFFAALVGHRHFDVDQIEAIGLTRADHFRGDELGVVHVVELADFVVLAVHPAVVAGDVSQVAVDVVLAHDAVVIGVRVADRLGPFVVPVQALAHVGYTAGVLDVERRDALAVFLPQTAGAQAVGNPAVA